MVLAIRFPEMHMGPVDKATCVLKGGRGLSIDRINRYLMQTRQIVSNIPPVVLSRMSEELSVVAEPGPSPTRGHSVLSDPYDKRISIYFGSIGFADIASGKAKSDFCGGLADFFYYYGRNPRASMASFARPSDPGRNPYLSGLKFQTGKPFLNFLEMIQNDQLPQMLYEILTENVGEVAYSRMRHLLAPDLVEYGTAENNVTKMISRLQMSSVLTDAHPTDDELMGSRRVVIGCAAQLVQAKVFGKIPLIRTAQDLIRTKVVPFQAIFLLGLSLPFYETLRDGQDIEIDNSAMFSLRDFQLREYSRVELSGLFENSLHSYAQYYSGIDFKR